MTLPNDYARCAGWGDGPEDWLDECHDCQRRTTPPGGQWMAPPETITTLCEYYIPPYHPDALQRSRSSLLVHPLSPFCDGM